jgi:peptide/nickel transport system substrate-binding protein
MLKLLRVKGQLAVSILLALSALAVVACAGGEVPEPSEPAPAPAAPPTTAPPPEPAQSPAAVASPSPASETAEIQPVYGGTLKQVNTSEPPTFDVQATSLSLTTDHTRLTHNRLVRYKSLTSPEDAEYGELSFVPDLAESWDITGDGTVFTFHLRQGVKWADVEPLNGRELVAEDVAAAFRRIYDADLGAPTARFKDFYEPIVSVEAPDQYTLVMTINEPKASWMYRVADGEAAWIPSVELIEHMGADYGVAPDSLYATGPFVPKESQPGSSYTYERNPNYWEEGRPYLDEVQYFIIPDSAAQEAAFVSGQIDIYLPPKLSDVDRLTNRLPDATLFTNPGLANTTDAVMFNMRREKWQDVRIRQAIRMAIDQDRIIQDLFQGEASYNGCIPTALQTYALGQDELRQLYARDVEGARALLKEAGVGNGFTFELMTFTGYQQPLLDMAELIQQDLADVGITVNLNPTPVETGRPRTEEGNYDAVIQPHSTGVEPDEMMGGFRTGGARNFMGMSDPKVDEWAAQQAVEFDVDKRAAILKEFGRYCAEQAWMIPLPEPATWEMAQGWVKNWAEEDVASDEPREWFTWIER